MQVLKLFTIFIFYIVLSACSSGGSSSTGSSSGNNGSSSSSSSSSSSGGGVNLTMMFANVADNMIIPIYNEFDTAATAFESTTGNLGQYCNAIGQAEEATALSAAQDAWQELMTIWQKAEMIQVGPITEQSSFLRELIHSYGRTSGVDTCLIDRNVVRAESDGFDITQYITSSRGLNAIEYLLFNGDLNHTCSTSNSETSDWNTRSDSARKQARCNYAKIVAEDVAAVGVSLVNEWSTSGENYRSQFVNGVAEDTLQELSDALFYFEKTTKDIKLGITTGIKGEGTGDDYCAAIACPDRIESPYSETSLNNIKVNLETFWQIYTGGDGLGFDDIIAAEGMESVNAAFETDVNNALQLVNEIIETGTPLITQVQDILDSGSQDACLNSNASPESVQTVTACSLHGLLKRISDRLRTDFVTIVNVDLPASAQSDAD